MPGYYLIDNEDADPGSYEFEVNKVSGDALQTVNGKFTHRGYKIKTGAKKTAPQQIGRTYTDLVATRGGSKIWERFDAAGGGTTAVIAPAEAGDNGSVYVQVEVKGGGEFYDLYVVEQAPTKGKAKTGAALTSAQIADALKTKGRVAVPGLVFDAGKGSIKPESTPVLVVIAEVLKSDPALKLEIQAHADNSTTAQARANVVRMLLIVNQGVADARLTASGIRDASNSVELVKK